MTKPRRKTAAQTQPQPSWAETGAQAEKHGNPRVKVQFYCSPHVAEELRQLASERDVSVAELLRYSVRLYKLLMENQRQGRVICFLSDDGALSEVTVP